MEKMFVFFMYIVTITYLSNFTLQFYDVNSMCLNSHRCVLDIVIIIDLRTLFDLSEMTNVIFMDDQNKSFGQHPQ